MIIDIHTHFHSDMARLVKAARENGIDRICVSSLGIPYLANPTPDQVRACNDQTLAAIGRHPASVIGFCYLNPLHNPGFSRAELRRCARSGMRGIKLWIAAKASNRRLDPICREAVSLDMPVLQHAALKTTGNLPDESAPDDVADLARRHPRLNIIMAHITLAGARGLEAVKDFPNVYADTSGGDPAAGITDFAVRCLGPDRLLFGSDAPGRNYAVQLTRVLSALSPGPHRDAVLGGTARRLLRVKNRN